MKSSLLARVAPVMVLSATLLGGMTTAGFAQSAATPPSASSGMQGTSPATQGTNATADNASGSAATAAPSQTMEQMADQRIDQLHSELNITQKEQPKWNRFATVMRDNAKSMDQAYQQRAGKIDSMNAVQNMESYAHIERLRSEGVEKLVSPFKTLYASLSSEQKQQADSLFRNRAEAAQQHHQAAAAAAAQSGK